MTITSCHCALHLTIHFAELRKVTIKLFLVSFGGGISLMNTVSILVLLLFNGGFHVTKNSNMKLRNIRQHHAKQDEVR